MTKSGIPPAGVLHLANTHAVRTPIKTALELKQKPDLILSKTKAPREKQKNKMTFNYQAYIEAYNGLEDGADKSAFFTEDAVLETAAGKLEGRDKVFALFASIGSKAKEQLRPLNVFREGDKIMAELDAAFMPREDWDGFLAPMKKGQAVAFRFFAIYELREEKIAYMRLASWARPVAIEAFEVGSLHRNNSSSKHRL